MMSFQLLQLVASVFQVKDADLAWIDAQITARPSEVGVEREDEMHVGPRTIVARFPCNEVDLIGDLYMSEVILGLQVDQQPADAHLNDQHIDKCMLSALSGEAPFRDVSFLG